jgi:[ribosomal protein S5]-alanine N-acetyltransferase
MHDLRLHRVTLLFCQLEVAMLDLTAAFAAFPVFETERLMLRAPMLADTEQMFAIMSDPRVLRYFGKPPMTRREQAMARIESFKSDFHAQTAIRWAITERGHNQLIGTCGFWRLMKPHFRAEIGYELAHERWGQGLMTEALRPVLHWGFRVLGLHSVEAQIEPPNIGSQRVLEKLGFIQEAYFRENYYDSNTAQFSDTAVFSLLRADWMAS